MQAMDVKMVPTSGKGMQTEYFPDLEARVRPVYYSKAWVAWGDKEPGSTPQA